MSLEAYAQRERSRLGRRLAGVYTRTFLWYMLGVLLLWLLGLETIYGHPAPFYALYAPAFDSILVPGTVLLLLGGAYLAVSQRFVAPSRTRLNVGMFLGGVLLAIILVQLYQEAGEQGQRLGAHIWGNLGVLRWHLLALFLFAVCFKLLYAILLRAAWFQEERSPAEVKRILLGAFAFSVLFACAIAMLRGGPAGISQAYERAAYEYVGDIGKAPSIAQLFARYTDIHPMLSMHAKVHPPGPIALLWLLSYVVGRSAMALSLATVVVGSLAIFPLYGWARTLTNQRVALTAVLLYVLVPSVVIFTATSADILFTPFTLATLYFFDRAVRSGAWRVAALAGLGFFLMSILKFSLLVFGAYFAFVGLWQLWAHAAWRHVAQTAAIMLAVFLGMHGLLYLWPGFDMIGAFHLAKAQFDLDQAHLDILSPRLSAWTYRLWDPLAWFFFAGIPVSVLFIWRLLRPTADCRALFLLFLLTLVVLNLLYLARGEGERSALYVFPFLVLPAAHALDQLGRGAQSLTPLLATLAFLAFQCWFIESYFYTYW